MSQSPLCPFVLSHRVPVFSLVSHYLTNYLIGRKPLPRRHPPKRMPLLRQP